MFVQQWFNNQVTTYMLTFTYVHMCAHMCVCMHACNAKSLTAKAAAPQRTIHLWNSHSLLLPSHTFYAFLLCNFCKMPIFVVFFFFLSSAVLCRLYICLKGQVASCWAAGLLVRHICLNPHMHTHKSATKTLLLLCQFLFLPSHVFLL